MAKKKKEEIKEEKKEGVKEEAKSSKRAAGAAKRKKAKKQSEAARWSGAIMFAILLFIGFLLWVLGEVGTSESLERQSPNQVRESSPSMRPAQGIVIIE